MYRRRPLDVPFAQPGKSIALDCHEAILIARGGEIERSRAVARAAYHRAQAGGVESDLLVALNSIALCQVVSGAYIEAMATGIDAHRLAVRMSDRRAMLQALTTIVTASLFILETSSILHGTLDRCLAEAKSLGDATLEMQVRNGRGIMLLKQQQFEASIAEIALARELIAGADGSMPAAILAANIAGVRMRKAGAARPEARAALQEEAEAAIRAALLEATRVGNREAISRSHFALAGLFQQRGQYPPALDALNDSCALADALRHSYRKTGILLERGRIYIATQNYGLALEAFDAAHMEAQSRLPCKDLSTASDYLAKVHESLGNRRAADKARLRANEESAHFKRECMAAQLEVAHLWQ